MKEINRGEQCVVSRYIDNPLQLHGYKFDLRLYIVVTSFDPLRIYIYREGLVRFATQKYSNHDIATEESKFTHLTNYSINKKNENFVQNEDADEQDSGYKWSLSAFCKHFEDQGIDTSLMWAKIYDVVIKSLICIEGPTKVQLRRSNVHRSNCYELLGYDILLDANLNPWLLEVNLSPSLAFESPLDLKIKANLIKDLLNLIGVRKPPQHMPNNQASTTGTGFNSAGARDNSAFFKGKIGGKIVKKGVVEEKLSKINNNLNEQISKSDLNEF